MKKLLLILLCLPMIGFGQVKNIKSTFNFKKTNNYSKIYTYNNFINEDSVIKRNVCDSIIILNADKQNIGEFIIDVRKAIATIGKENTKWIYTYGNTGNTNIWTPNFVPDTIVVCILSQATNPSGPIVIKGLPYTCGSKWVWNGLIWDKQKEVPEEQFKSTLDRLTNN